MAGEYGVSSQTETLDQLMAGPCEVFPLLVDAAATAAIGQVLQYDATGNNYVNYTSSNAALSYVVCTEARDISGGDALVGCIVQGRVRKTALDATAQADAEIDSALVKHGIIPVGTNERLT